MATIKVKQVKSRIKCPKDQKRTLDALGLRKMNQIVELKDLPRPEKESDVVRVQD